MSAIATYSLNSFPDLNGRGAFAIYCDDLRQEVSGKQTYVGVYEGAMYLPELPFVLPQLFVVAKVWTTVDRPFKKLVFRIILNDEVIGEDTLDVESAHAAWIEGNSKLHKPVDSSARILVSRIVRFAPLVIQAEGGMRIRIETEDGEFRAGGLAIGIAPRTDPAPHTLVEP